MSGITKSIFGDPGAAGRAGDVQAQASLAGIGEQRRQFDITQEQLAPFREAELRSLEQQQALAGLSGPEAQQAALAAIQETPGQQFSRQQQEKALLRNQAAIGGLGGGNIRTALQEQAAGFASADLANQIAQLQGVGRGSTVQSGQFGQQFGQQFAQGQQSAGQARASGILGQEQMRAQRTGQIAQLGSQALGFALLSDKRIKKNISNLDTKACFDAVTEMPLKVWRYLDEMGLDTKLHLGPMAQDAPDMVRIGEIEGIEALNLHDELMMIAGALQYMRDQKWH